MLLGVVSLTVKLKMLNRDRMIFDSSPSILKQFVSYFTKPIFFSNPNTSDSPENFVKLYSVFQKLAHLTCSKLKLQRPSITPLN